MVILPASCEEVTSVMATTGEEAVFFGRLGVVLAPDRLTDSTLAGGWRVPDGFCVPPSEPKASTAKDMADMAARKPIG
jgi:hypothetical protein